MAKSAGVDNIPAEFVQAGGEAMIDILTAICNKIWKTGEWPTTWTQSLIIILPKKGNLQLCQNYRTVSLISHPSKVMLKIIVTDSSHKQKRSFQKSKQVSEPEGAPQNKYSISGSSARNTCSISRISRLQEGPWHGMARSLMGNYEEIQHHCQHNTSHWKSVWQGPEYSPVQWQHRRMVQN